MRKLIAVTYDTEFKAEEVRLQFLKMQKSYLVSLEDAVVVEKKQNGKVKLHQMYNLTACGAVLRCSLPPSPFSRAAICLAGPAASFALTALANPLGAYRLAGASALLGLFDLLPIPPLDGGMALRHLADGRFTRLLNGIAGVSVLVLLAGGVLLWKAGFGGWLFLAGLMVAVSFGRA